MAFLIDTNILFAILKGDEHLKLFVESNDCGLDSTVYVECIQGSKSNREKRIIIEYLRRFRLYYHTPTVSQRTIHLIDRYSNSHGLLLPDAQIAAVALERGLELATLDTNDLRFIKELKLAKINV